MQLKTKIKAWGIVTSFLVLATWVYLFDPTRDRDDYVQLSLLVTFEPAVRSEPITIVAGIDGAPMLSEPATESPWQETIHAPKLAVVSLMAVQPVHGPALLCSITSRRGTFGPNHAKQEPPGTSTCFVTAIA